MRPKKGEKTPGSGRKPGTPNKYSLDLIQYCEEQGVHPFKRLIQYMKGEVAGCTPEQQFKATVEACQYLYPKRKSVEQKFKSEDGVGFRIIVEDYSKKEEVK